MNIQQIEQMEYEAGLATEQQNAYAMSVMEANISGRDDSAKIERFRAAGLFVVLEYHEVCCRHTDAIIGHAKTILGAARSQERACRIADEFVRDDKYREPCILPPYQD